MSKKEAKVKSSMELGKAIAYLNDLVASLRAGTVSIENGDGVVTLHPEKNVKVALEATQKEDRESISLRIAWKKPDAECKASLRISAQDAAHQSCDH
ncbi:MAG: amphi-Trp domain-containing protein [Phycisphaerales bacterium]|nr:amphi-Trp domain-containing protein [Phycisphaerales bacterium]